MVALTALSLGIWASWNLVGTLEQVPQPVLDYLACEDLPHTPDKHAISLFTPFTTANLAKLRYLLTPLENAST